MMVVTKTEFLLTQEEAKAWISMQRIIETLAKETEGDIHDKATNAYTALIQLERSRGGAK